MWFWLETLFVGISLYWLKRWTSDRAVQQPKLQTWDALDRLLHWIFVVTVSWITVAWLEHTLTRLSLIARIGDLLSNQSLP